MNSAIPSARLRSAAHAKVSAIASPLLLFFGVGLASCGGSDAETPNTAGAAGANALGGGGAQGLGEAGAPSCNPAYTCGALIGQSGDPAELCPGSAAELAFKTLNTCVCSLTCKSQCGDSACMQAPPSTACLTCIMDSTVGCGAAAAACAKN